MMCVEELKVGDILRNVTDVCTDPAGNMWDAGITYENDTIYPTGDFWIVEDNQSYRSRLIHMSGSIRVDISERQLKTFFEKM